MKAAQDGPPPVEPEVIEVEPEKPKEEEKTQPAQKKGPRPKGTKRFKKMALEEPERDEEMELSTH
jgi:hypothetical protein